MTLLHFHSQHPVSYKEYVIYSQALQYNMITSEDHILQAELNNLTRILLARAYPLHLIIKKIKNGLTHSRNYLLSKQAPHTETNILPIIAPFSDMDKQLTKNSILKISSEFSADTLHNLFTDMLKTGNFPDNLKLADITPVFKIKNPLRKVNYRPVSALPSISKAFEKLMQKQISG